MFVAALFIIMKNDFLQSGEEICGIEYNEMDAIIRINMRTVKNMKNCLWNRKEKDINEI